MSTTLLVQEIDERLLASATIVCGRVLLVFLAPSEELDGGVGSDTVHLSDGLVMMRVGIHIGDNAVLLVLKVPRDVLVDGFERLAVSTPGCGESDENVLGVVQCDGVEIVNAERRDLRWGRWFDVGLGAGIVSDAVGWLVRAREWGIWS